MPAMAFNAHVRGQNVTGMVAASSMLRQSRLARDELGRRGDVAGEAASGNANHLLPDFEAVHLVADADDRSGEFAAERSRISGYIRGR